MCRESWHELSILISQGGFTVNRMSFLSTWLELWKMDPVDATVLLQGTLCYCMLAFPLKYRGKIWMLLIWLWWDFRAEIFVSISKRKVWNVQGQVEWDPEQPDLGSGIPVHDRRLATRCHLRSLPAPNILQLFDSKTVTDNNSWSKFLKRYLMTNWNSTILQTLSLGESLCIFCFGDWVLTWEKKWLSYCSVPGRGKGESKWQKHQLNGLAEMWLLQ